VHHALGQLVLPVGDLVVLPLVLALVRVQLQGSIL
jgi:galactitol-specific phosphotransferase system IIC component